MPTTKPLPMVSPTRVERDYLSFSAISSFQGCPLRYYFRYVKQVPEESIAASLLFGSSIHAAIQHYFEQLLAGSGSNDLPSLMNAFQDEWSNKAQSPVHFGKREDFDSYCRLAERTLSAFLKTDWAHPKGRIVGIEEELRGHIVPGCAEILGRLDLLIDAGEEMVLTDFKTSRSAWSEGKAIDAAPQLLLYSELAQPLAQGRPIKVQFAVMTKTQTPTFALHRITSNPRQIARTKRIIQRVWSAIRAGTYYPNPSPINCSTCAYRRSCAEWNG